jgi:hypothetical protein
MLNVFQHLPIRAFLYFKSRPEASGQVRDDKSHPLSLQRQSTPFKGRFISSYTSTTLSVTED